MTQQAIDVPAILANRLANALNHALKTVDGKFSPTYKQSAGLDVKYAEAAARDEGLNPDTLVALNKDGYYFPKPERG